MPSAVHEAESLAVLVPPDFLGIRAGDCGEGQFDIWIVDIGALTTGNLENTKEKVSSRGAARG